VPDIPATPSFKWEFLPLFREVQKTFEDFSQRTPFARFSSDALSPKIDIAESKPRLWGRPSKVGKIHRARININYLRIVIEITSNHLAAELREAPKVSARYTIITIALFSFIPGQESGTRASGPKRLHLPQKKRRTDAGNLIEPLRRVGSNCKQTSLTCSQIVCADFTAA